MSLDNISDFTDRLTLLLKIFPVLPSDVLYKVSQTFRKLTHSIEKTFYFRLDYYFLYAIPD